MSTTHVHGGTTPRVRRKNRRAQFADPSPLAQQLSRTKAPTVAGDLDLWPAWTHIPIEGLGLHLVDDAGHMIRQTQGRGE
jgi:hypothetical protein